MTFVPICILMIGDDQDCELMQTLYARHSRTMYRAALRILSSPSDTEDAVSSACVSLIRNIDVLRAIPPRQCKAYILSTVQNEAKMLLRRRQTESHCLEKVADRQSLEAEMQQEVDNEAIYNCTKDAVKRAILRLPAADREILKLKVFDKLPDATVAQLLNVKPSSVRSRLRRARIRLHAVLEVIENE